MTERQELIVLVALSLLRLRRNNGDFADIDMAEIDEIWHNLRHKCYGYLENYLESEV